MRTYVPLLKPFYGSYLCLLIIGQCCFWSCSSDKKRQSTGSKDTILTGTVSKNYEELADEFLYYKAYNSLDELKDQIETEFADDYYSYKCKVYQDRTTSHTRVAFQKDSVFHTFRLLPYEESDKISIILEQVDFDNSGMHELVIDYRKRDYYSSAGSAYSGVTQIWNLDSLTIYKEIAMSTSEDNSTHPNNFYSCESIVKVSKQKIHVYPKKNQRFCPETQDSVMYCLVDGIVDTCR